MKKSLNLIIRSLKLYLAFPKPAVVSKLIQTTVNSLMPFINIYFSAIFLNELIGERNEEKLIMLVIITVVVNLLSQVFSKIINQWAWYCYWEAWRVPYKAFTDKLFSMDYIDLENPKIQEKHSKIVENMGGMNFGLPSVFFNFDVIIAGFIQIIVSIAMAVPLFTIKVPVDSPYTWLNSPLALLIIIFIICLNIFLAPYITAVGGRIWKKAADENKRIFRMFDFMLYIQQENRVAADIRIYDQVRLINKAMDYLKVNPWLKHSEHEGKYHALSIAVNHLANGLIYLFVSLKAFAGAFGAGNILIYVNAITQFSNGFAAIFGSIGKLKNNNVFLEQTFNFLDMPNRKYQGSLSVEKRDDNEYEIEFKNVSFKYPSADKYALKNLSLKFKIGKKIAVVGMNGSGKTTMIKLLCRLYDPNEGVITLNGFDIKKYNYDEYMAIFSVVFQDFKLLPFTLGENIAISVDYDKKKVTESLEKAGFKERLDDLPNGLNTYLYKKFTENGVDISGGEAQKIALARALYKNSPFIILDEPTAALDPIAEYEIYSKFNEIIEDKTAVFISHRLSSCRFCDDIVVFHEGQLIQRGSHNELITDENGKYYELWNAQAQYYK